MAAAPVLVLMEVAVHDSKVQVSFLPGRQYAVLGKQLHCNRHSKSISPRTPGMFFGLTVQANLSKSDHALRSIANTLLPQLSL